jgi:hypothetical protein
VVYNCGSVARRNTKLLNTKLKKKLLEHKAEEETELLQSETPIPARLSDKAKMPELIPI